MVYEKCFGWVDYGLGDCDCRSLRVCYVGWFNGGEGDYGLGKVCVWCVMCGEGMYCLGFVVLLLLMVMEDNGFE